MRSAQVLNGRGSSRDGSATNSTQPALSGSRRRRTGQPASARAAPALWTPPMWRLRGQDQRPAPRNGLRARALQRGRGGGQILPDAANRVAQRRVVPAAGARRLDHLGHPQLAGRAAQGHDAVRQVDGLLDVVGDEQHGLAGAARMRSSSSCSASRVIASRALKGSSISSTSGSTASARASDTRWRWPPDSSCGQRSPRSPRPTSARASPARRQPLGPRQAGALQPEGHIGEHPPPGQQPAVLEHQRHRQHGAGRVGGDPDRPGARAWPGR